MANLVMAKNIRVGDQLDLEGDEYADTDHDNPLLEFEYAIVEEVELETPQCVAIVTSQGWFAFPAEHELKVENMRPHSVDEPERP